MSRAEPYWKQLHHLVEGVLSKDTPNEVLTYAVHESSRAIPADCGAVLFTVRGGRPYCIRWPEYAADRVRDFNSHFNRRVPVQFAGTEPVLGPVSWSRYADTEFVSDFHRPLGVDESLGASFLDTFAGEVYALCVHRGGIGHHFTDREVETLRHLTRALGTVISLRSEIDAVRRNAVCDAELGPDADVLSRREAEVARLICRRLSMREIAGVLKISTRTVERHAFHIYQKLGVANRKELAKLLRTRIREW